MQRTYPGPVTDSCFVDEIDVILGVEDNKSIKGNGVAQLMLVVSLM